MKSPIDDARPSQRSGRQLAQATARVIRRIIGVPDYDEYLAHVRRCHPTREPLTREGFARDVLTRRYETPGNRCC